jgi:hypothetical protein
LDQELSQSTSPAAASRHKVDVLLAEFRVEARELDVAEAQADSQFALAQVHQAEGKAVSASALSATSLTLAQKRVALAQDLAAKAPPVATEIHFQLGQTQQVVAAAAASPSELTEMQSLADIADQLVSQATSEVTESQKRLSLAQKAGAQLTGN